MTTEASAVETERYTYETSADEDVSEAVVRAVARLAGRRIDEATGLPPLYEAVDPDALNALFSSGRDAPTVQFTYDGYIVTVDSERQVIVAEP